MPTYHCSAILAALLSLSTQVQADGHQHDPDHSHQPHQHGVATLLVAQEGDQLEILLSSPADNIVGFEHRAETPSQIKAVSDAEQRLNAGQSLFSFAGGSCTLSQTEIELSAIQPDKSATDEHEHEEKHRSEKKEQHGEINAHYHFRCQSGQELTSLTTQLINTFPAIEKLTVQWITENGQGAKTLSANQTTLQLK